MTTIAKITYSLNGKVEYTPANVAKLVLEKRCYQTVADIFGVTRERVRQIAKAENLPPMRDMKAVRNEKLIEAAKTKTLGQIATEFKMKPVTVNAILKKAGIDPLVDADEDENEAAIAIAVDVIAKTGASIRSVSQEYGLSPETVRRYCKKANIVSTHGRWHKAASAAA